MLIGLVPAYHRGPKIEALYHLYFIQSTLFGLTDRLYATRRWVASNHFDYEYNVAPSLIRDWLAVDLIKPTISFDRYHYFDHQQLKDL